MNTTVLVAIITALSAIIPNILITYLNNKQQFKIKKFEIDEVAKRQVIFEFSTAISEISSYDGTIPEENFVKYQCALSKLLFYFPNLDKELLDYLDDTLCDIDSFGKIEVLQTIIKELSKELLERK